MNKYRTKSLLCGILCFLLLSPLLVGRAREAWGATGSLESAISPPITELTVAPGETLSRSLLVENKGGGH